MKQWPKIKFSPFVWKYHFSHDIVKVNNVSRLEIQSYSYL